MTCTEAERAMSRLLDGELEREARLPLAGHLSACDACRDTIDAWTRIGAAAVDALRGALPSAPPVRGPVPESRPGWKGALAMAASILALITVIALALRPQSSPMDDLMAGWAAADPGERDAVTRKILDRWADWKDADLDRLRRVSRGEDESSARARSVLSRIEARRKLGPRLLAALEEADSALLGTEPGPRVGLLREAAGRWRKKELDDGDLTKLAALLEGTDWASQARELMAALGNPPSRPLLPALRPLLKHPDRWVRTNVLILLGYLRDPAREAELAVPALGDSEPEIRSAALELLKRPEALPHAAKVLPLLKDPDARVRHGAVVALSLMGSKEHVDHAVAALDDPDPFVRIGGIWALEIFEARDRLPRIARLLKDPDASTRWNAAQAVERFGSREHLPLIVAMLKDPDAGNRGAAADILGSWRIREQAGAVAALLDDEESQTRVIAARAVLRLDAEGRIDAVLAQIETIAREYLWQFTGVLMDEAPDLPAGPREKAAAALEKLDREPFNAGIRRQARLGLVRLGRLDAKGRLDLLEEMRRELAADPVRFDEWSAYRLLDALLYAADRAGWDRVHAPVPLPGPMRTVQDLRTVLVRSGLELEGDVPEPFAASWQENPVDAGIVLRRWLPSERAFILDGRTLRVVSWTEAFGHWEKRLGGK